MLIGYFQYLIVHIYFIGNEIFVGVVMLVVSNYSFDLAAPGFFPSLVWLAPISFIFDYFIRPSQLNGFYDRPISTSNKLPSHPNQHLCSLSYCFMRPSVFQWASISHSSPCYPHFAGWLLSECKGCCSTCRN